MKWEAKYYRNSQKGKRRNLYTLKCNFSQRCGSTRLGGVSKEDKVGEVLDG